jgi:hypothetical protein
LCNTIFYHLLRCHPGKFCIFLVLLIIARKSAVSDCQELYCTHEEADTRMILHAIHAEKTFGESGIKSRIIVKSPDTDVLILCIHYFPSMQHTQVLWFHKGSITNTKDGRFHAFPYIRSVASSILFYITFYCTCHHRM